MLRSPLVFTARSGSALTTFAPVVLDCSNEEKECALAHAFGRVVIGRRSCSTPRLHKAFLQEQGARLLRSLLLALIAMPDPAGCGKRERLDQRGDRFISTLVGYDWHRSLAVVIGKTFRLFCLVFIPTRKSTTPVDKLVRNRPCQAARNRQEEVQKAHSI
jgi:hypothetical protein